MSESSEIDNASLVQLLRECASIIEDDDDASSSGLLYKTLEALTLYTEKSNGNANGNGNDNKNNGSKTSSATTTILTRPSFQRPTNKSSNLIANGWVLQQRRSKIRVVWKEVLASLVEARRPGEETTLWIQRETVDMASAGTHKGKKLLQALHQIPMKWLLDVKYLDFYGDFRFSIKVFNVSEDFVFRTADEESCKEWVATLKSAKDASGTTSTNSSTSSAKDTRGTSTSGGSVNGSTEFPDLLNRNKHEGTKAEAEKDQPVFPDLDLGTGEPEPSAPPMSMEHEHKSSANGPSGYPSAQGPSSPKKERKSVKELRAIAHAEGYDTRGMERSDLEKIAAYFAPVSVKNEVYRQQQQQQQNNQRSPKNQSAHTSSYNNGSTKPTAAAASAGANLKEKRMAAEAERIRKHQEEERIKQQQEYVQKKLQDARKREEDLKKHTEAAKRREEEAIKRKQQQRQQQQQQQQQQTWNNAHTTSHSNGGGTPSHRPQSNQPMFESSRFFDSNSTPGGVSGPRRKQPTAPSPNTNTHFSSQSRQQYTSSQPDPPAPTSSIPPPPPQQSHPQYHHQQTAFNHQTRQQQQRPAHHSNPMAAPPKTHHRTNNTTNGAPPNTNNNRSSDPTSPLNQKYAKVMANNKNNNDAGDDQAAITSIKRNILITWGLVPPQYNMLRPIDQLLSTIQHVLPPFANVSTHEYFSKWKVIEREEICLSSAMGNSPDEAKLKKAVRKLRVLLHPDRLPREFDKKQSFVCKMLWDVSNDAYEEFLKQKDDLDWIHK